MTDAWRALRPSIVGALTMFYYADLAAAADWYETVLGFERIFSTKGLELFRIEGAASLALVQDGYGSQRASPSRQKGAILSIHTDQLEAWHARLFALGVEGTGLGLEVGADGMTIEFKVHDPGGYTVEFFEWIE